MNKIECGDCPLVDIDVYGSCYQYCEKMKARKESDYEQGRTDTIDECIDKFAEIMSNMKQICGRSCPVNCNWGTTTSCKDMCKKWLFEKLKEQK